MTTREVHFSRLLDLVSGSSFAAAKTKVQKSAIYRDFDQNKLGDRFRSLIGEALPAFYIVDPEVVVQEILNGLLANSSKIISSVSSSTNVSFEGDKDFQDTVERVILENKSKLEVGLLKEVRDALDSIKAIKFTSIYYKIQEIYENLLDGLAKSKSYIMYRNAAIRAGYDLRSILSGVGTSRLLDGANIVENAKTGSYVFIGATFKAVVQDVNKVLAYKTKSFLESNNFALKAYNNVTKEGYYIGQFINAGHTAAFGPNKEVIGVNMPSAQEVQFALGNSAEALSLDTELSKIYADVGYTVNFTQNYTTTAKTLLNLQFAFVITMPTRLNTVDINIAERARIKELTSKVIVPSIQEVIKQKFKGGLLDTVQDISASPTLLKYVVGTILDTLKGNKPETVNKKNTAKKNTKLEIPISVISKKKKPLVAKKTATKVQMSIKNTGKTNTSIQNTSLAPLQALLDQKLFEQIKSNMGTGTAKNVLNFRTGRLARSAKVERLSKSREGMITAFYTYMKNPYATFSENGLQSSPKTRDPKLLISKSIREIGATLAYNRMRAVLV